MWKRLENWKRNIESIKKGLDFATEQINARRENIKQHENRCDQFLQNRLFQNKQKKIFEKLVVTEDGNVVPNP